jgi:alginate O-acetyltransferase complex protein AlgI
MSLIFYAWGEPVYIIIMIFSTIFDYTNGRLIYKYKDNKRISKKILIFSITVNLGILCFFKYYGFIVNNLNQVLGFSIKFTALPLPLGISFYTFQTMSYVIDVYKGLVPAQRSLVNFVTYVSMFPQLLAGPIVKYRDVEREITERNENIKLFGEGIELFIIGMFKKVFIANNIGAIWSVIKIIPTEQLAVLSAWLGIIAFTFQIYFDFSGYSDMAIGLGKMFGFNFPKNFNYPYTSKSITEFWRRWHMTLGGWFREYVYIPLGGNREGKIKCYRNIFVVWLLTGLWHGANWNFILWGLYYGALVVLEKLFILKWLEGLPKIIRNLYSMVMIIIGWALFEFEDLHKLFNFLGIMFGVNAKSLIDNVTIYYSYTNILMFIIALVCSTPICNNISCKIKDKLKTSGIIIFSFLYMTMVFLCTAYLVNQSYNPFLYFRF